ncbi:MAG: hypothetical protein ACLQPH_15950 [Acidimicrobiales bacterium]
MPRSELPGESEDPRTEPPLIDATMPGRIPGHAAPPELIDSWDPADDEMVPADHRPAQWDWYGYPSWGRKAVAAFPFVALVVAVALFVSTTLSAQGAIAQVDSVAGTRSAVLLSGAPPQAPGGDASGNDQSLDYHDVSFQVPGAAIQPIQGSTSLELPPFVGWEANGSAGPANGLATVSGGLLHVSVRHATPNFRGWFLTATTATPKTCAFQFSAASPPPVTVADTRAVGELVMAVQTSRTASNGDINYVMVTENVYPDGRRNLIVGYSLGHVSRAVEHNLKQVPWSAGPLQVAIETNGNDRLDVWVNGALFFAATDLHMGITPPFEPYLEVQARQTAYTVEFDGYSSVCQDNVVVSDLPDGSLATLGTTTVAALGGSAVFPMAKVAPPVTGDLSLSMPGNADRVRFSRHRYWPGDRYSYAPGT